MHTYRQHCMAHRIMVNEVQLKYCKTTFSRIKTNINKLWFLFFFLVLFFVFNIIFIFFLDDCDDGIAMERSEMKWNRQHLHFSLI